ncbi:EAL domain-containing protein [Actinokineospora fastidiosa]|uniref:Signal transduction protein n=1 Tax=Actinokineospora fastidiosa TaxID=1816 RepID=A0A918GN58_9PSEU|nr:EAL domain-containing protein [Actinokineospora fastidiosa]GGS49698.1 signal transduction protein [Actinokineospora fastidiosa]
MDRAELPARWAAALSRIGYAPLSRSAAERELAALLDRLPDHAGDAGARLVRLGYRQPECLRASVELLAGLPEVDGPVIGALAEAFTAAARDRLFAEQEDLVAAVSRAKDNVERSLKASEARFTELFDTSALGMVITDIGGGVVRANEAIETMLGYARGTLFRKRFDSLLHPEDRAYLRTRYAELTAGGCELRERTRFQRADGDTVWTRMAVSVLRDADGLADHHVTMVEDISDLHLLEHRITYQGTHDMLTGLPNRAAFTGRLEEALGVGDEVAVLHLSLDDFAVVNDGIGRHAGDVLLTTVAARLADLVDDGLIARIADHEFAVLLRSPEAGPCVAARINDALVEPTYVDGTGIAVSATVAVVSRPRADTRPADLLRATDITIRELRQRGRRQWGMVDIAEVDRRVDRWSLTAAIPGAWENGELDVDFDPVVTLADGAVVAARGALRWDNPTRGRIAGADCASLLADTGMGVCVGRWLLSRSAERVTAMRDKVGDAPRLYVELTADSAADPDLVAEVRSISSETGLPIDRLDIGLPVPSAAVPDGPAAENAEVLAELGVRVVLTDFGRGGGDLGCVADLPVHAVRISDYAMRRVSAELAAGSPSLVTHAVRAAVPLVRAEGVSVIVPMIADAREARWWRDAGADLGQGPLFGEPGALEDIGV